MSSVSACSSCHKASPQKRCGGCRVTQYCNVACQTAHWLAHKQSCLSPNAIAKSIVLKMIEVAKYRKEISDGQIELEKAFLADESLDKTRIAPLQKHLEKAGSFLTSFKNVTILAPGFLETHAMTFWDKFDTITLLGSGPFLDHTKKHYPQKKLSLVKGNFMALSIEKIADILAQKGDVTTKRDEVRTLLRKRAFFDETRFLQTEKPSLIFCSWVMTQLAEELYEKINHFLSAKTPFMFPIFFHEDLQTKWIALLASLLPEGGILYFADTLSSYVALIHIDLEATFKANNLTILHSHTAASGRFNEIVLIAKKTTTPQTEKAREEKKAK